MRSQFDPHRCGETPEPPLDRPLILRSGISFHTAADATLLGSSDPAHYRPGRWLALLLADSATGLHLSGKGTINGQGRELAGNIEKLLRAGKLSDPPDLKRPSERHRPLPQRYPEFSMFGELPLWALFIRHTRGIVLRQSRFDLKSADFRPALALNRSLDTELEGISLDRKSGRPLIAAHASPGMRILNPSQALAKDDLRQWKTELATQ